MSLLECFKVTKYFGGLAAVKDIDLVIKEDELVGLIGPNGSGKTTLFNCISGAYPPSSGKVEFKGEKITGLKPNKICSVGIGRTFQIVRPFLNMTSLDNVMVGAIYGTRKRVSLKEAEEKSLSLLEFVGLEKKAHVTPRAFTISDRKMLEIARALATEPELILLDEVLAGLNDTEMANAIKKVRRIRDEMGITIIWIEHVMRALMRVVERAVCLNAGLKIAEGTPKEVSSDKKVIESYLGKDYRD